MDQSLCDTKYGFNNNIKAMNELFRNQLVADTIIIQASELSNLKFQFKTLEANSQEALDLEFNQADFTQVDGEAAEALFKMAAHNKI